MLKERPRTSGGCHHHFLGHASQGACCLALSCPQLDRWRSLLVSAPPEHDSAEQTRIRPEETVGLFYSRAARTRRAARGPVSTVTLKHRHSVPEPK
ncbi:hypothetical protein LY76DRAFT_368071 [Colletotrichum caudatum]|nr:hypothetical protein LY76DRAFT_368071 [Colletotrichum caudatum]